MTLLQRLKWKIDWLCWRIAGAFKVLFRGARWFDPSRSDQFIRASVDELLEFRRENGFIGSISDVPSKDQDLIQSANYVLNPPMRQIDDPGYSCALESQSTYMCHARNLASHVLKG